MSDISEATEIIEDATSAFTKAYNTLHAKQNDIADQSKRISGALRDSQQKLADGLDRISKTADFPKMERYVQMLERAAAAMQILAEMEKTGHLAKFAQAMK